MTTANKPLLLNFKTNTRTTVSRDALQEMAASLGFTETQTVHIALARLRDEVLVNKEDYVPLTDSQHQAIAKASPSGKGKVVDSLLGF